MIRFTVNYPKGEGATFDHAYYANTHIPLCNGIWNPTKTEIDKGIDGPNVAAVHFYFDSMETFQSSMGSPRSGEALADVPNYTNIIPTTQLSEIVA
jgi:uncharacterized protein (TIGR02118 family)